MRLSWSLLHVPWRAPLASSRSRHDEPRPLLLVRLEARDGLTGFGEAAPLPDYDGVTIETTIRALELYAAVLARTPLSLPPQDPPGAPSGQPSAASWQSDLMQRCAAAAALPQALAAVDLALWDLRGRRSGCPVWELLASPADPSPLRLNATVGAVSPDQAHAEVRAAARLGYRCVKVKVGTELADDLERVGAVAREGLDVRLDANGAWGEPETALAALDRLTGVGPIELCEEPVHGAGALATVAAASPVAIAADESSSAEALGRARLVDSLCLKVSSAGGITPLLAQAHAARRLGYGIYLASTLDGPLGIAAALHAGVAVGPDRPCGLGTLDRFEPASPLPVRAGALALPQEPGLGESLLRWYEAVA